MIASRGPAAKKAPGGTTRRVAMYALRKKYGLSGERPTTQQIQFCDAARHGDRWYRRPGRVGE